MPRRCWRFICLGWDLVSIKNIALLGSTGSIGRNTLDVVQDHPQRFRVVALAAGGQVDVLVAQARCFRPEAVAIFQSHLHGEVAHQLADLPIQVWSGAEGVARIGAWPSATMVVSAIVGAAGLQPTLAAIRAGKDVALANKECLVTAGGLFMKEVADHGVRLIPVDSEHSAIFQVWQGYTGRERIILTASGGPFRGWRGESLARVTPQQALAHPNWVMGQKITIDSATMMNKGLEVIEAHWLFGVPGEHIQVVIHPESIIHSMVAHPDGSVLAQLGVPDMRTPIAVALAWPERLTTRVATPDFAQLASLTFFPPPAAADFPCLDLAYQALAAGGSGSAILNAANEVAVAAFLQGRIGFTAIGAVLDHTLAAIPITHPQTVAEVMAVDALARQRAGQWIASRTF